MACNHFCRLRASFKAFQAYEKLWSSGNASSWHMHVYSNPPEHPTPFTIKDILRDSIHFEDDKLPGQLASNNERKSLEEIQDTVSTQGDTGNQGRLFLSLIPSD